MELREFEPGISQDTAFYWEGTRDGKALVQQCGRCKAFRFPPSPICANCQSFDVDIVELSGKGNIYSVAECHHPQMPIQGSGYLICLVELEEGIRFAANLRDCTLAEGTIGLPVEMFFEPLASGYQLPQFRLAS
jgi:uncharacterized OB-fold protein